MKRRYGEGSIFKRKDGRWSAQTYITLVDGSRKRVCFTDKKYETVKEKMRNAQDQEHRRIPYVKKDWKVSEYLDYWMSDVQPNRIRETTLRLYSGMIEKYIKPTLGNHKLSQLSAYEVRMAINTLEDRGCTARTRIECLKILSACLNCAMREELIYRNVAQLVEKPKYIKKETTIWTAEQASFFLNSIKNHPQYILFLLLLTYGMRRGEALGLRYCDIDFENGLIHIRQQISRVNGDIKARELKTANSRRTLPLVTNVRAALIKHAEKNNIVMSAFNPHTHFSTQGTVVISSAGTPLEPGNVIRCFTALLKGTGLPRIKIHAMRHTAATVLKELNVPVKDAQLILGHSDISTTLNIYQHGTPDSHRTAISAIEGRFFGESERTLQHTANSESIAV